MEFKRRPLCLCPSTGSATATKIKSQSSSSLELRLFRAGMRAVLAGLDEGEFTEGHELDRQDSCASLPTLGQAGDFMSVDTEDHLLPTRQLDDEFQLLAGRMH